MSKRNENRETNIISNSNNYDLNKSERDNVS